MSGHSKWSSIKHQKAANDSKRAQLFTKLISAVRVAVREGGNDPGTNAKLRIAIDRAKTFNVPKDNIARALTSSDGEAIESFAFDAIGPGGVTMIIEGSTDNRNRTLGEIRHLLAKHDGKLAQEGSARWAFTRKGLLTVERSEGGANDEKMTLAAIEGGADDVRENAEALEVIVPPDALDRAKKALTDAGFPPADTAIGWIPQQETTLNDTQRKIAEALFSELDDHPDVQAVWSNETIV